MNILPALASDETTIPDIRELLACINHGFGGTQAYAEMLVEDVKAATAGSTPRLSFHNNYLTAIAKFGGNDDLNNAPTEVLEAEAERMLALQKKEPAGNGDQT